MCFSTCTKFVTNWHQTTQKISQSCRTFSQSTTTMRIAAKIAFPFLLSLFGEWAVIPFFFTFAFFTCIFLCVDACVCEYIRNLIRLTHMHGASPLSLTLYLENSSRLFSSFSSFFKESCVRAFVVLVFKVKAFLSCVLM